jgi:hypothetical protein
MLQFAALVLTLDNIDGFSTLTYWTALAFLILRSAHSVGMISVLERMPIRTMLFTGGWMLSFDGIRRDHGRMMQGFVAFSRQRKE